MRVRELAPAHGRLDWTGADAIAEEILRARDVAGVTLQDQLGTVMYRGANRGHPGRTHRAQRQWQVQRLQRTSGRSAS